MKKVLLFGLSLSPLSLMGMEAQNPAIDHDNYYCVQKHAAMKLMEEIGAEMGLPVTQNILDFGCKQGNISGELAKKAFYIEAFDENNEAIEKAKEKYSTNNNLCFICKPACEEFASDYADQCELVTSFFCLERYKDDTKKFIFNEFFKVLKPGGWVIATVPTNKDASIPEKALWPFMKMIRERYDFLKDHTYEYLFAMENITEPDLENMLTECGFDKTETYFTESLRYIFADKVQYCAWQRSVFMEMPLAQVLLSSTSPEELEEIFQKFVDIVWNNLEIAFGQEGRIYPIVRSVVVTQKPKPENVEKN